MEKKYVINISRVIVFCLAFVLLVAPAMAATTQVQIIKYANDDTTILNQTTVNYTWMMTNLPVLGDGTTHYYHQGPVFVDDTNETLEQELRWNPAEDTNVDTKDMGAVKGTNLKDLCDLVGGMSPGEEVKILAVDGWSDTYAYKNVYQYSSREGPLGITWYMNGLYPDTGYSDGMRMVWFADDSINTLGPGGTGIHAFGNYDWHEAAAEEYWYYYIQGGENYPTTTGLSGKYINRIYIFSDDPVPVALDASFTADVQTGTAPLTVQFTDASTGTPTSWAWDFTNDGTVDSTGESSSHIYDTAGTFTVNLTVRNAGGSDSEVKTDYIVVSEAPPLPVLNVNTGIRYATIQAAVTAATAGNEIVVADGSYTENVVIDKSITIRSENGAATTTVTAANSLVPTFDVNAADFVTIDGFSVRGATGSNIGGIDFTDSDSGTITNNDVANGYNGIHLGGTSTNNTISYNNCHANSKRGLSMRNDAFANYAFRNTFSANTDKDICIKDMTHDNVVWLNNVLGGTLDIGTANTENSPTPITYTYGGSTYTSYLGNYYSVYAGVDADGNGVGDTAFISGSYWSDSYPLMAQSVNFVETTLPPVPVAVFSADPVSGNAPLTVQFTDASTGTPTTWAWDFTNDGTVDSTEPSPSHTYDTAGTYTVNLTVSNAGGSDSEVKTDYIVVSEAPPLSVLNVNTGIRYATIQAAATAATAGNTILVSDGSYTENVVIDKSIIIRSENGAATTTVTAANSLVPVFDVNAADFVTIDGFTVRGATGSNIGGIDFTDSDSGTITNNDVANGYNGIHLGGTSTNNTVSDNNCHDNSKRGLSMRNDAFANYAFRNTFSANTDKDICIKDATHDNVIWLNNVLGGTLDIGTANTENSPAPITYTYGGGTYTSYLGNFYSTYAGTDADGNGVGDTAFASGAFWADSYPLMAQYANYVETALPPAPVAAFGSDTQTGTSPLTVYFTDASTGTPTSWAWDFTNDGTVDSTEPSPSHVYDTAGTFTVNLTVTNAGGSDSEFKTDYITVTAAGSKTWYVDDSGGADFTTIQAAVNAATEGDTIIVKDGSYSDSVDIGKRLTILSENGPESVIVQTPISVTANFVNLTGFTTTDIIVYGSYCNITENIGTNCGNGIHLKGGGNTIANNNVSHCAYNGIWFEYSWGNNSVFNNTFSYNFNGIKIDSSNNNLIFRNNVIGNQNSLMLGLYLTNSWNTSEMITYTYNGTAFTSYLGNYYSDYSGSDDDGNGVGTPAYSIDLYPLMAQSMNYVETELPPAPLAAFSSDTQTGTAPLTVNFTDASTGTPTSWAWDFTNDGTVDSTDQNPSHVYDTAGTYTVNLTVTNAAGSDSEVKSDYVTVTSGPSADILFDGDVNLAAGTFSFTAYNTGTAYQIDRLTPHGALDAASKSAGFTYNATDKKWATMGTMLLDDVAPFLYNNTVTPKLIWAYQVNGVKKNDFSSTEGISVYRVNDTDLVEFYYGEDGGVFEDARAIIRARVHIRDQTVLFDDDLTLLPGTFSFTAYNSGSNYEINTTTPHGALDAASKAAGFTYNATDKKWATMGTMLLDDVGPFRYNNTVTPNLVWAYAVNGITKNDYSSAEGISSYQIQNNDRVEFFYGPKGDTLANATVVVRIRVHISSTDAWTLSLKGATNATITKKYFEEAIGCIHNATYTDVSGTWGGVPLWALAGYVDDAIQHGPGAFNDTRAAEGYTVKVIATDGYNRTFNSADIARNDGYIVANTLNGQPLPVQYWPLKLVGEFEADNSVAKIGSIELSVEPIPPSTEVPSVRVIKYAADGTTEMANITVNITTMETNYDVIGDGSTVYKFEGINFLPNDIWDANETYPGGFKIENAVKGTRIRDLADLAGGMGSGTEIRLVASDNWETILPYSSIYTNSSVQARQGDAILAWWADGQYVPAYSDGIRVFFTPDDHIYGQWDMHETLASNYWHYYYQDGVQYPSAAGLSAKWITTIKIYSAPESDWSLELDGSQIGGLTYTVSKTYFEQALACQFGANHSQTFTDTQGNVWTGMPLWFLAGFVDDADQHSDNAFNNTLAASGYNVVLTSRDGAQIVIDSRNIIRNNNYIVANTLSGVHIPDTSSSWPLRLVGPSATGATSLKAITSIDLVPVVPQSSVKLAFVPEIVSPIIGGTKTMSLVLSEVPAGLSGTNVTVSLQNSSIATITGVSFPGWAMVNQQSALPAETVTIKALDLSKQVEDGAKNVTIATFTISGDAVGSSQVLVTINAMDDDDGTVIVPSVTSGLIRVLEPIQPINGVMPTDPDGDGLFDDLNGNGRLDFNDVVIFFNNMEYIAGNEPVQYFDFNGNGRIDFDDIVEMFWRV